MQSLTFKYSPWPKVKMKIAVQYYLEVKMKMRNYNIEYHLDAEE